MNNEDKTLIVVIGFLVIADGLSLLLFGKAWRYMLGYQSYLELGFERYFISSVKILLGTFLIYKFNGLILIKKLMQGISNK